jgi:tetratricopeptide (TPR) repeat protein
MLGSRSPFTRPLSAESVQRELAGFEAALAESEAAGGTDAPAARAARRSLAKAYRIVGRPAEALALSELNAAACERMPAAAGTETLTARMDLTRALIGAGRSQDALDLQTQVRADAHRAVGSEHRLALLADLDLIQARLANREQVSADEAAAALASAVRFLGPDDLDTMYARSAFTATCLRTGRAGDAIATARANLACAERVLGTEDVATDSCRADLGRCYLKVGRSAAAVPLLEQAYAHLSSVLGADSPYAHYARAFLAEAYLRAGQPASAVPLLTDAIARNERLLGAAHRTTTAGRRALAAAYLAAGRADEAVPLLEQALADTAGASGANHKDTLAARMALAYVLAKAGRVTESLDLYRHIIAERTQALGPDDPATVAAKKALADVRRGWMARARPNSMLTMTGTPGRTSKPLTARRLVSGGASVLLLLALLADIRLAGLHVTRPCLSGATYRLSASGQVSVVCGRYGAISPAVPALRIGVVVAVVALVVLLAIDGRSSAKSRRRSLSELAGLPASATGHMTSAAIRASYRSEQSARYGEEFAELAISQLRDTAQAVLAGSLFQLTQATLLLLFAVLYRGNLAPFIELYIPVEMLVFALAIGTTKTMQAARKQLAEQRRTALGLDVGAAPSVPSDRAAYVKWCEERGIEAYPHAGPQIAPAATTDGLAAAPDPA